MPELAQSPLGGIEEGADSAASSWLAVWTKPRAEKAAARMLDSRAVTLWLPTMNVRRRWSDRWKEVEIPLFPGYLFARASVNSWPELLRVPNVLTVVKQDRRPAWISERQIAALRVAVDQLALRQRQPELVEGFGAGDRVRVVVGPMAGLVGVVREIRGSRRLLIGIEQIGRAIAVSIGSADVEPCAQ